MNRARVLSAGLVVGVGATVGVALLRGRSVDALDPRTQPPSQGAQELEITRRVTDWLDAGYVEMVAPLRSPSSADGRVRIVVFLWLPPGARFRTVKSGDTVSFEAPPGTKADRVEVITDGQPDAEPREDWQILDVRGLEFAADGPRLRVLRPRKPGSPDLLGLTWRWGEDKAPINLALSRLVLDGRVAAPAAEAARAQSARHLVGLNDCETCHTPNRPGRASAREPGRFNRGSDASGFVQVTSVLSDRQPFETYRSRDMNLGDDLIVRYCGETTVDAKVTHCSGGLLLEGELRIQEGLRRGDRHTQRVCASRRALAAAMDADGRAAFAASLAACGVGPSPP